MGLGSTGTQLDGFEYTLLKGAGVILAGQHLPPGKEGCRFKVGLAGQRIQLQGLLDQRLVSSICLF